MVPARNTSRARPILTIAICVAVAAVSLPSPAAILARDNPCYKWTRQEKDLAGRLNDSRANSNVRRLKLDPEISKYAARHSDSMAQARDLLHSTQSKLYAKITNASLIGENVVVGDNVNSLHRQIMRSAGHRYIMLHPEMYNMGVGISEARGDLWATVIVTGSGNPGTTLAMPDC